MNDSKTMNAVWLEDGELSMRNVPVPSCPAGEALIKLRLAGICGTDLELIRGYYPYQGILGHEFVGEVVDAPDGPTWIGKRVVGEINASCGTCPQCLALRKTHCEQRTVLGIVNRPGVFCEYFSLPIKNLIEVPQSISDENAVLTEPVAAACEILEQLSIKPTDRVLLIGAGRLGQLVAQVLSATGCDLSVIAKYPSQKQLLKNQKIKTTDASSIGKNSMDIVVEATGDPGGFKLATQLVRPRGTIVLKSTYHGQMDVDFSAITVDEIAIIGSRCGPFAPALRLMQRNQIKPSKIIKKTYPLEIALEAFNEAKKSGNLKILLGNPG